jgi:hypothetical protein
LGRDPLQQVDAEPFVSRVAREVLVLFHHDVRFLLPPAHTGTQYVTRPPKMDSPDTNTDNPEHGE